ncbi:tetratricopeptide repeat protein [Sphingorhabdus arenilitoris]|uniref:Tetratricopeptide repeat protein n=1 Tax=Sphingorhabdus arenilitoris TaxID=1490041 RepID=A0ABV8RGF2_9SPHN
MILLRPLMILALAAGFTPLSAYAQAGPSAAEIKASNERELNSELLRSALRRIASRPTDVDALVDAGNAALALQDANAALNFFTRANGLQPNDGRIKLGLATASVRTENPFEALRYFDEAVKLGISDRTAAADRAVAFDLLGNFDRAQQDYALARTADNSEALAIKQAVSLSLSGKAKEADAMLLPYLQNNSGEAWRARAFMLAARGDTRESVRVTQGFMDPNSASRFEPFLRKMPELTGAQQAAAIYFGHFPARNIGRDSPEIRDTASRYAAADPQPKGNNRLIPAGKPLGKNEAAPVQAAATSPAAAATVPSISPAAAAPKVATLPANNRSGAITSAAGGSFKNDVARTRILAAEQAANSLSLVQTPPPFGSAPGTQGGNIAAVGPSNGRLILPRMPVIQNGVAVRTNDAAPAAPQAAPAANTQNALPQAAEVAPSIAASPLPSTAASPPAPIAASAPSTDSVPSVDNFQPKLAQAEIPAPAPAQLPAAPPVESSPVGNAPTLAAPPSVASEKPADVPKSFDLGAIVDAIEVPASEKKPSVTPVDLSKIKVASAPPPNPKPAVKPAEPAKSKDTKSPAETYPARTWVQIATGEVSAFKGDMRRHTGKNPDLFKGMAGWSSPWKNLNRLVIGPFDDLKAARKWESDFRAAGGDGFVWQSGDGTVVEKLK